MEQSFKIKCSLGIFVYNEEKNIGKLLTAILDQELNQVELEEILVMADACTDQTIPIVQEFAKKDNRIKLSIQSERKGKALAIDRFLKLAKNDILIIESGDTIPDKNTIENLVRPFKNKKVGMTGGRPIPVNNPKTLMGFVIHQMWDLHHQISLQSPKMGEMVALRRVFKQMPPTAVDEAQIEEVIKKKSYQILYIPEAIVYNKGPETMSEFLRQRRRIYCGHLSLAKQTGHQVSTLSSLKIFSLILKGFKFNWRYLLFTPVTIMLEGWGRFLGWWDYKILKKDHLVWKISQSTKDLKFKK